MERLATKTNTGNRFVTGVHEYSYVIQPDVTTRQKIAEEKNNFNKNYFEQGSLRNKSSITIASFNGREEMEETIVRYTQRICSMLASFNVELNNYSGFPSGEIFIRIQNPQPFKVLAKSLDVISNYIKSCSCAAIKTYSNPHIQVASQLKDGLYLKAMMDYSQKTFHETFMANELVLLRRNHQYDESKTIQVFRLQPPDFKMFAHCKIVKSTL